MRTYEVIKKKNVSLPITVLDAKQHLNLEADFIEDDDLINSYIKASERYCSGIIGGDIAETEVTHKITNFLGGTIRVKESPFKILTSVKHYDADNNETIIDVADCKVYEDQFLFDLTIPADYGGEDETILFVYTTGNLAVDIPEDQKSAIRIKTATLYDHEREDYSDYKLKSNRAVVNLLAPYSLML